MSKKADEVTREMTFEEEYEILQAETTELFVNENTDSEPPFANCVVRRALRCIRKLLKELEVVRTSKKYKWEYCHLENTATCENCGYNHYLGTYHQYATKFCPNCGSEMEEVK